MLAFAYAASAQAQTSPTAADLDRLSQQHEAEMPHRDWGTPPPQSSIPRLPPPRPLAAPAICMSTTNVSEDIHLRPDAHSPVIGTAAQQAAVTDVQRNGWRKVFYTATRAGWIPETDLIPFHPLVPTGSHHCVVTGARPNGVIVYDYPR
ncbi:hypothetical protein [Gluconacetobacter sacchari]|nr:hypothetical protein [Gluconacetobacter sacchari]